MNTSRWWTVLALVIRLAQGVMVVGGGVFAIGYGRPDGSDLPWWEAKGLWFTLGVLWAIWLYDCERAARWAALKSATSRTWERR